MAFYIPAFLAMLAKTAEISGVPAENLTASFKRVHERWRTTEYSFSLQELDVLPESAAQRRTEAFRIKYNPAIEAFRAKRRELLRLYPGVRETLEKIRQQGIPLIAYSESMLYHATRRLRQLGIEELFTMIVASKDHGLPPGLATGIVRKSLDADEYLTRIPLKLEVEDIRKPDPSALRAVLNRLDLSPAEVVYVGDSPTRDIPMAQACGVLDVLAAYGSPVDPSAVDELLKITYWTRGDIEADERQRSARFVPTFTIQSFPEILDAIATVGDSGAHRPGGGRTPGGG
jgi:phosphoglycolate phosphatase